MSLFDELFTNLYSLSKTLRFELKPTSTTEDLLKKNNIIEQDVELDHLYKTEMKPLLDKLHQEFIEESLSRTTLSIGLLEQLFNEISLYKSTLVNKSKITDRQKDYEENIEIIKRKLRREMTIFFDETAEIWKTKYQKIGVKINNNIKGMDVIFGNHVLEMLHYRHPDKKETIKKFKGLWTYFTGYNLNRKNYYTSEPKTTSICYRTIDENLSRYISNILAFDQIIITLKELEEFKDRIAIQYFNRYLNQNGIDEYNNIIGGQAQNNIWVQGFNERINMYQQRTKIKLPKLKFLYKQIGSDRRIFETLTIKEGDEWENLNQLLLLRKKQIVLGAETVSYMELIGKIYAYLFREIKLDELKETTDGLNFIYLNKSSINTISNSWFVSWQALANLLQINVDRFTGEQRIPQQLQLSIIKKSLNKIVNHNDSFTGIFRTNSREGDDRKSCLGSNAWDTLVQIWEYEIKKQLSRIDELEKEFTDVSREKFDKSNEHHVVFIKKVCDTMLGMYRMIQYFLPKNENLTRDENFYGMVEVAVENDDIIRYYNAFRNYITKKSYCENKVKLTFKNGTLLEGWAQTYKSFATLIFSRNNKYYLGIINDQKLDDQEIQTLHENINFDNDARRFTYEMQKPDNKNTPRLFIRSKGSNYSPMVRQLDLPIEDIINIYDQKLFQVDKKKPNQHKPYLKKLIDYYKIGFKKHPSFNNFHFHWRPSDEYENIAQFYNDVTTSCYKTGWEVINFTNLNKLAENGRIYIFEIYNKDLSDCSHGRKNIHTMLFLELLNPANSSKLKLLGGGELFYRAKSMRLEKKDISIEKNEQYHRITKNGVSLKHKKRFLEDKFFLHFPIEIRGESTYVNINKQINTFISENDSKLNILALDRGERNLLYYSLINLEGKITKQGSLDVLCVGAKKVDFNEMLSVRQKDMRLARESWSEIGAIKNFKEGYLSQAIHEICKLSIDNNALIVLEDLNSEFKAKRMSKVEKSVYKKFELALIKKLNHLVLKDKKPDEPGGVLKAYQLTPYISTGEIKNLEKRKQMGILFYVRANYTSTTDPLTGWRKHIYLPNAKEVDIKNLFNPHNERGVTIQYSEKFNCWGFRYKNQESNRQWELFAAKEIDRYVFNSKTRRHDRMSPFNELNDIFSFVDPKKNIYEQLINQPTFSWKRLYYLWNVVCQIRNTDSGQQGGAADFIQSPVFADKINGFFDSRKVKEYKELLPENGDANGAYNIARKGLMLVQRIKQNPDKYDGYITDSEWDRYVTQE